MLGHIEAICCRWTQVVVETHEFQFHDTITDYVKTMIFF